MKKMHRGYWNDELIINELKKLKEYLGKFPVSSDLTKGSYGLKNAVASHGGINRYRILLGEELPQKPNGYWTEEKIIEELKKSIERIGHFPTQKELTNLGKSDLVGAICVKGKISKYRQLMGYDFIIKPKNYWTEENTIKELKLVIENLGHFPKQSEFKKINRMNLEGAINKHGGINNFRKLFGLEPLVKPNNYWTEERVINETKKVINEFGYFPTQIELSKSKYSGLIPAMTRYGGLNNFRLKFGLEPRVKPNGYWSDEKIIKKLNILINKIGYFPTYQEMDKIDKNLLCTIDRYGGIGKFRKILGYEPIYYPDGYWSEDIIIEKIKIIINDIGHFPSFNDISLSEHSRGLLDAIRKFGGIEKFRNILGYSESLNNQDHAYYVYRGKKSEKEVKKILQKYCIQTNLPEPSYNKKLSKGNILEFVCNAKQKIGIDVTNTKNHDGNCIKHKYLEKDYHKYLDKLWIVVLSNIFTDDDYIKFNEESPENVEIMSVWDLIDRLQVNVDEYTHQKLKALEICTFHTKNDLINQLKARKQLQGGS